LIAVVDASLVLNWVLHDEQSPQSDRLFDLVAREGGIVPSLWRLEIANALQVAMRRNRIDQAYRETTIQTLQRLPIEIDQETDAHAWTTTLRLSDRHRIAVYDAAYLDLALRRGLPLATRDQDLVRAARESGVTVLPAN
jgi:predicted nucleic acid-binding protein